MCAAVGRSCAASAWAARFRAPSMSGPRARPALASARDQSLDELLHLAFGDRAHEAVDRLAVPEGVNGRDRLDAQLLRDLRVLVDIHLDHAHLALGVGDRLLEQGGELFAGPAPGRPEIDDHRGFHGGVQHVGRKGRKRCILDQDRSAVRPAPGHLCPGPRPDFDRPAGGIDKRCHEMFLGLPPTWVQEGGKSQVFSL